MDREAWKDFTLSNGTFIPKGAQLSFVMKPLQLDRNIWGETGDSFNGFRSSDLRKDESESAKHQAINASPEFIPFGYGRHTWYALSVFLHYDVLTSTGVVLGTCCQ